MLPLSTQIHGETFELHPLKAMWWKEQAMLVCADVHIGKGAHFRNSGIPIPKRVNDANLWNLVILMEYYNPAKILFLGDLFHSRINNEWEALNDCLSQFPSCSKILIKGNHEIESQREYERLGFEVYGALTIGSIRFLHEPPASNINETYTLCGHLHPAVRLQGSAQQSLRLPCFWLGKEIGVLPAFGEFTGSHTIQPKKGDSIFVVADNQVIKVN